MKQQQKNCSIFAHTQFAMLSPLSKLSVSRLRINSAPRLVLPNFGYVIGHSRNSRLSAFLVKSTSPYAGLGLSISCKRLCSCRAVHKNRNRRDTSHDGIKSDLSEEANSTTIVRIDGSQHILGNVDSEDDDKGTQRTDKTCHGNKGRVPWNKGLKHSEETREKISRRTKEALKDPKIRKKMSEVPRVLSNQTKVKIRASLTKLWGRRLKLKRLREKVLQSWGESIALAAKIGIGPDQQELEWDSYEKFKQELALRKAEKAKMKELARKRKERAAQVKTEKKAKFALLRREQEDNAKARGESIKKWNKKSKEEKEKLAESQEEKLKERLMKIHRKKSRISHVSDQNGRAWEKFDLELAKGKHLQKEISLADQIRFAKKRRAELLLDKL
ncbi:hypothetical protein C2S52_013272 [Perilla frutescens var. hirtella]|nr:hypothetical protein C2S52_013272 [Perilla frutescens var. hirtella]